MNANLPLRSIVRALAYLGLVVLGGACHRTSDLGGAGSSSGGGSGSTTHGSSSSGQATGTGSSGASGSGGSSSSGSPGNTGLDAGLFGYCEGSGAPIVLGDSTQAGGTSATCLGTLAQTTFRYALCTCEGLNIAHPITTDSYELFADGGNLQGRNNGSVGTNHGLSGADHASHFSVGGSLWVSDGGTAWAGSSSVAGELHSGSAVNAGAGVTVGENAYCASTVDGQLSIAGNLYLNDGGAPGAAVTVTGQVIHQAVAVADPCDCTHLVDIAGIVASHQTDNDNRLIGEVIDGGFADGGLDPATWASGQGPATFAFPCGRYFISGVTIASGTSWTITGRTALLVDGDFAINAGLTVNLDPGSELDLFIAGNLSVGQPTTFGSLNSSPNTRIYVGGNQAIALNSPNSFFGNVYAPFAEVQAASPSGVYGSIFGRQFTNSSPTNLHFNENILTAGQECIPPAAVDAGPLPDGGSTTFPDGGAVTAGQPCQTCSDCGNQACVAGQCGSCTTSADCCSPLLCVAGSCQLQFR